MKRVTLIIAVIWLATSAWQVAAAGRNEDKFFARDKLEHFCLSVAIAGGSGFVAYNHFGSPRDKAVVAGFSIRVSWGGIKEKIDSRKPAEHSSLKDLAVDILGSAVGAALLAAALK